MVAHREVVGGHLADRAQGDGVVLAAGRDVVVDDVGDAQVDLAQRGVGLARSLLRVTGRSVLTAEAGRLTLWVSW